MLTKALARDKDDRFATCRQLVAEAQAVTDQVEGSIGSSGPPAKQEESRAERASDGSKDPVGMIFQAMKEAVRDRDRPSPPRHPPPDSARRAVFDKVKGLTFERFARPAHSDSVPPSKPVFTPPRYLIGFQSLAARSRQLQKWLLGGAALDAAVAVISGFDFLSIAGSAHPRAAARAAITPEWIAGVQLFVFLVVGLMFVVWFYRAYTNLPHLGVEGLRFSRVWALTSWVIPIVNLWRPKQLMNDIWRASDPDLPAYGSPPWRGQAVPGIFLLWWCALVGGRLLGLGPLTALIDVSVIRSLGIVSGRAQGVEAGVLIAALASGLSALAGLLAVRVVGMTSARQEARLERLLTPPSEG